MSKRTKTRTKRSVHTQGFRISKVRCCYTCSYARHGENISCELTTSPADWTTDKHYHPGISAIGICPRFKLRKGIGPADNWYRGDNIIEVDELREEKK